MKRLWHTILKQILRRELWRIVHHASYRAVSDTTKWKVSCLFEANFFIASLVDNPSFWTVSYKTQWKDTPFWSKSSIASFDKLYIWSSELLGCLRLNSIQRSRLFEANFFIASLVDNPSFWAVSYIIQWKDTPLWSKFHRVNYFVRASTTRLLGNFH